MAVLTAADVHTRLSGVADYLAEDRVALRVLERWQHRGLSDVTKPDHCVTDLRLSHLQTPNR